MKDIHISMTDDEKKTYTEQYWKVLPEMYDNKDAKLSLTNTICLDAIQNHLRDDLRRHIFNNVSSDSREDIISGVIFGGKGIYEGFMISSIGALLKLYGSSADFDDDPFTWMCNALDEFSNESGICGSENV
jgi:hypothetical protein